MRTFSLLSVALILFFLTLGIALAWTGPTQAPTGGNVSAPVNIGSTAQTKSGTLGMNGLAVFGNTLLSGSSRYLNWGSTAGSSGYGIRDNSGTLEFKNSGGSWTSFGSGGLTWLASGNNIYNTNSGNVGVGTASPTQKLHVSGTVLASAFLYSSDRRLKDRIAPLGAALDAIEALVPVTFIWNEDAGEQAGKSDIGFIAQEVEDVLPVLVTTDSRGMKSVDYPRLVPVLVRAIQEQQAEIDSLKADIDALKSAR